MLSSDKEFFESKEFQDLLEKYLRTKGNGTPYFEIDELSDIFAYHLFCGDIESAKEVLAIAWRIHPASDELKKMEVRMCIACNNYDNALERLSTISFSDNDVEMLKAEVFYALKDFKAVHRIAEKILKNNDIRDEISYDALELMLDCGFAQDVLQMTENALTLYPDNKPLWEVKAEALIEMQHTDEAISIYNDLLDKDPYSTFYWEQLGHIYYMCRRYGKALDCFDYELSIDNGIDYAKMMQAYCYYHLHDYDKALQLFGSLNANNSENGTHYFYIALILWEIGDSNEAYTILNKLSLVLDEECIEQVLTRINLSVILDDEGEREEAEEHLKKALSSAPENTKQLILNHKTLYELRDKENLTFADMNILEVKDWKRHETFQALGEFYMRQRRHHLAKIAFIEARKTCHDTADIDAYLAYIYFTEGESTLATECIESAIEGRSNLLFELFGMTYDAAVNANKFSQMIGLR